LPKSAAAKKSGRNKPLTTLDWIYAARKILTEHGINDVRIEPLARHLGVSKGSFYWHFRDRRALLDAILADWRQRAAVAIIDRLEHSGQSPREQLHAWFRLPFERSPVGIDQDFAIRLWGRNDPKAKAVLAEMDELRLRYSARLIESLGVSAKEARARAVLAYSYARMAFSLPIDGDDPVHALIEKVLFDK
jgi:AcrR family transcriptional regulator